MDTMQINKVIAAVLVVGIAFFMTGLIGDQIVRVNHLAHTVLKIDEAVVAAPTGGDPVELTPIGPLLASAEPAAGERLAKKLCSACHSFTDGGKAGVGPNLYGIVGNKHAHTEGFGYSDGMKAKAGPWTFDELNAWLKKPAAYVVGTRMAFAGINNDKQRADVIDYLRTLSASPEPLPK